MDRARLSRGLTEVATSGRKQFISTIKSELKKSPLASNVILGLILAGLEKFVEVEFACPCKPELNAWFASAFFIFPGVTASVLMLGVQRWNRNLCQKFVLFGLVPILTWLVLVFLDGQYFACARTDWSGRFVIVDKAAPQRWCEPDNTTLSVERMNLTQQWYFHSQGIGLMILVMSIIVLVVYKCVSKEESDEDAGCSEKPAGMRKVVTYMSLLEKLSSVSCQHSRNDNNSL